MDSFEKILKKKSEQIFFFIFFIFSLNFVSSALFVLNFNINGNSKSTKINRFYFKNAKCKGRKFFSCLDAYNSCFAEVHELRREFFVLFIQVNIISNIQRFTFYFPFSLIHSFIHSFSRRRSPSIVLSSFSYFTSSLYKYVTLFQNGDIFMSAK